MKIGIDIQALQTEGSKNRGIGRYSKNLFSKILELDKENDYTIFQNSYYNNSINLPKQNNLKFKKIVYANEKSLGFLNKGFNELMQFFQYYHSEQDILHVSSPFEGFPYKYPIISKHLPRLNCALTTTLFDLIPLVFSNIYLNTNEVRKYYFQRLDLLKKCDFIFSISEASRIDAINLLGIEPSKIINIGSAPSANFYKTEIAEQNKQKILKKYSIPEHFILYTGGIDFRKNIERTIEAFSKLDTNLKKQFKFVIVCKVEPHERAKLQKLASTFDIQDNIILTGFVPDEELNILYNVCSLFLFPSLYEGAGLPILEAMRCGAPVISSNSSSLAELVEKKDFMFDPYDVDDMAALIERALTDDAFRRQLQNHSYKIGKNYSWEKSARKVIETYKKLDGIVSDKKHLNKDLGLKPTMAYFSPLPPQKSGISEYSKRLLPRLAKYYDIDLFVGDYEPSDELKHSFNCRNVSTFEKINEKEHYDEIIYQMGNSDFHFFMIDYLFKKRGIIVLHDLFLAPMQYVRAKRKDIKYNVHENENKFFQDIIYSHGEVGKTYVSKFKNGEIFIDKIFDELPVIKKFLDASKCIIVHSNWSKNKIKEFYPSFNNVQIVHHNSYPFILYDKEQTRKKLGFLPSDFLIGSFGIVGGTKKIDLVIKNLQKFLHENQNSKYLIVGDIDKGWKSTILKLIKDLDLSEKISIIGYAEPEKYKQYMSIIDVGINFRYPTRGETSATLADLLRAGIPTIVSNYGPMSELPNDCVIKVDIGEERKLKTIMENLMNNKESRNTISKNGKSYFEKIENADNCAFEYFQVLNSLKKNQNIYTKEKIEEQLINFIAKELSSNNGTIDDESLDLLYRIINNILNS